MPVINRRYLLLLLSFLAFAACAAASHYVFDGIPHGWDSINYYWQAKVLATGHLTAPATGFGDAFQTQFMLTVGDRVIGKYSSGWPLFLAFFQLVRLEQLANPILAGIGISLIWHLACRLFNERTAWFACILAILSPFYIFLGASYLSHMSCAIGLLAMQLSLMNAYSAATKSRQQILWSFAAAAFASWAFHCRPYSAILGMAGVMIITLASLPFSPKQWARTIAYCLPIGAIGVFLYLLCNRLTTGSWLTPGYRIYDSSFSFLGRTGESRESLWANVVANVPIFMRSFRTELWWGLLPDIWLAAVALVLLRRSKIAWALLAACALFTTGYLIYFYFDLHYGPRLLFEMFPWLIILSAAGADRLLAIAQVWKGRHAYALAGALLVAYHLHAAARGYLYLVPYYSLNYGGQGGGAITEIQARQLDDALVFVPYNLLFANVVFLNPPDPQQGRVVFARMTPEWEQVLREFPRDETWVLEAYYIEQPGRNIYGERFEIRDYQWTRLK